MKMTMMLRRVSTPATPMNEQQRADNQELGQIRVLAFCKATSNRPSAASWNNSANAA